MKKFLAALLVVVPLGVAIPASAARPTVGNMVKDDIGTPIAIDNGEADPGETMAFRFDVTNNSGGMATFRVEISTPDPFGAPLSGYTATELSIGPGATATTGVDALRMRIRQDAACGYRIPLVVRAFHKTITADESFDTFGIFVGEPEATPVPSRVGPISLGAPDSAVSFAPRQDSEPGLAMFWSDGQTSRGDFIGADGAQETFLFFSDPDMISGATLQGARGSDGWGVTYARQGTIYFRKSLDTTGVGDEIVVDDAGTYGSSNPKICFDPVVGWVITYLEYTGTQYNLYARRVRDDTFAVSSPLQLATNVGFASHGKVANGYSAGTAPDRYSHFAYYQAAATTGALTAYRFRFREPASALGPIVWVTATVETMPSGFGISKIEVIPSLGTNDGRYHHVVYSRLDWVNSTGSDLRVIRFDTNAGAIGTPAAILSLSEGFQFSASARGGLNELSVVYSEEQVSTIRRIRQVNVAGEPPVVETPRDVYDGDYSWYETGLDFSNLWLPGGRDVVLFAQARADDWHYLSVQDANPNAFETPMAQHESRITDTAVAHPVAAAAAGDRVGVLWASLLEGGVSFQLFDREGVALSPKRTVDPWSSGAMLGKVALASNGTNFLAIWQKPGDALYSYAILDGDDGATIGSIQQIPLKNGARTNSSNPIPSVTFTDRRYRFVSVERDVTNSYYVTGTIRTDGVFEPTNHVELGSSTVGSEDTSPDVACNGIDQCAVTFKSTIRTQTEGGATWNSPQTLSANANLLASDGSGFLVVTTTGTALRRWLDGSARSTGATGLAAATSIVFKGDGYAIHRYVGGQLLNTIQTLDLAGNVVAGAHPDGLFPIGSDWGADMPVPSSTALVWLPTGEGILVYSKRRIWETNLWDLHLTRFSLPVDYLSGCGAVANTPAQVGAIPPVTIYIRANGAPPPSHILTDGVQPAAVTFRGAAANAAWDNEFGGRIVEAGWDLDADGDIDVPVVDANGNGIISQAESTVVVSSADLVAHGFPVDSLACPCTVRFFARDQIEDSGWSYQSRVVTLVDDSHPSVDLLVPDGGEAWPGGSTQTIAWDADDNVGLGSFDLYYDVPAGTELFFPTSATLPAVIGDGEGVAFDFFVPVSFPVADLSVDVDLRWSGVETGANITLRNIGTGLEVPLQLGSSPATGFTSLVGNWDRTLPTQGGLDQFDGDDSYGTWRLTLIDLPSGHGATLERLALRITPQVPTSVIIAMGLPGETRSFGWTLPEIISPATKITVVARDTSLNLANDVSAGTFFVTQANADQVRTLVVWNEARMRSRYAGGDVDLLEEKLVRLAGHVKIDGVLLDLSSGEANAAGIGALYAAWDATAWNDTGSADNGANAAAANALGSAIRTFLYDRVATLYPNLETMILVGGDRFVPFFRENDTTPLHPESSYPAEIGSMGYAIDCNATHSPTLAATCANFYLSDGRYGASSAKPVPGSPLSWWLPDVAVGRLVETPVQIAGLIDTYVAQDGVTIAGQVTTTGYDFLTDGGDECWARLATELEPADHAVTRLSEALEPWSDTQLKSRLFGLSGNLASQLTFVSGHADHRAEGAAAAGGAGVLTTLELDSGTGAVAGAMIVGLGCHTGMSILSDGGLSDPIDPGFTLDLAELFASKRFPVFIGNTGFGWGLTDGVGLGERLIVNVVDEITRAGQVSLGEALRLAKQEYFLRQDDLDSFDHKVIHESTLYGIPNYEVRVTRRIGGDDPPAGRGNAARVVGESWLGDPSWSEKSEGGRRLRKSEAKPVAAGGEAPSGVSLRVMDFSYQAFAADPPAWQAGHPYDRMTVVRPIGANGHVYAATTAGTSGASQPTWPTGAGATVADGTVIWTEYSSAWPNAYVRHDVCRDTASGESVPCANADGTPGAGQTKVGVYLTLDGMATGEAGDAIQPMISFDSHLSGTKLHGIMIRGGEYEEPRELNPVACQNEFGQTIRCFDPVVGNPQTKGAYPEGPAPAPFVMYSKPTPFVMYSKPTPHGFDESNGNTNSDPLRWDNLNAPMGEMVRRGRTPDQLDELHTEWLYRTRDFSQFYSESSDWTAPMFGAYSGDCNSEEPGNDCYSVLSGLTATMSVPVTDAGDGVYRVYVTYSSDVDSSGRGAWLTAELSNAGGGVWTGTLELRRTTHYLVQAVDWAGNVATVDVTGSDVAGNGSPMGSNFTLPRLWTIEVPDSDADGLPDAWEAMHPCVAGGTDPDDDLLSNLSEFDLGLDPCNGDTDGGGDNDGSEQNHGRSPFGGSDDLEITIGVSKVGSTWTVDWGDGRGANVQIDGKYHVYRNSTPFFGPGHRVVGPLSDATKSFEDASPSCDPVCFYRVWNVALALPPPTVTVVSPPSGPAVGNTVVNVYGSDFVEGAAVYFRGVAATSVVVHNGSWISCRTPANATGLCDVKVVNPSGQEGVLAGGFDYTP